MFLNLSIVNPPSGNLVSQCSGLSMYSLKAQRKHVISPSPMT